MPLSAGGLGVRTASQIALPAFLSYVIGAADLCSKILPSRLKHAFESMTSISSQPVTSGSQGLQLRHLSMTDKKHRAFRL